MNVRSVLLTLAAIALLMLPAVSRPAVGDDASQPPPPVKVAVCDPVKVLQQIQEFKDMADKFRADDNSLKATLQEKNSEIQSMADELKLLLPGTPQYDAKSQELLKKKIETEAWARVMDLNESRMQKEGTKKLFDKIVDMISKVSQANGITLVLSSFHPDLNNLDNIDANTLNAELVQRQVLYNDPKYDITGQVVVAMDKAYTSGTH